MASTPAIGQLRVWWIPQVPMKAFNVEVETVREGVKVMDILASYDAFQYENKVKPDYCNVGGLQEWCSDDGNGTPGWCDWTDKETGENDPREWLRAIQ